MLSRRLFVAAAAMASLSLAACHKGGSAASAVTQDDMSLGNPNAKVSFVEYASVGCPICARWQKEVYPAFKAKYIDTGKVHYTLREMLVGGDTEVAIGQAGFLLARCAGPDKYFPVVDAVFAQQDQAFAAPRETLQNIARSVGMTDAQFNQCIEDEKGVKALQDRVNKHATTDGVNSTPTFVINGTKMEPGYHSLAEIDAAIAAASK